MKNRGFRPRFFSSILSNCPPQPGQAPTIPSHLQQRKKTKASPSVTFRNDGSLPPIRQRQHEQFCIIYCIFVRDFLLACVLGSVLSGLREDTGRIDGHSGVRLIHPTDRAPGTDTRILRSEANERPKKTKGSHKQPLWNSSRKIPIPKQPAERPEHSAEGDRNAGFTHVRAYAVASISLGTTGPAAIPEQNPERPEHGGDYARRRNETEKGKRPDRSRERTALEEYDEYEQKKEPCIAARLLKEAATYSPTCDCSTIGVSGLNFSVRNGKRWDPTAITT